MATLMKDGKTYTAASQKEVLALLAGKKIDTDIAMALISVFDQEAENRHQKELAEKQAALDEATKGNRITVKVGQKGGLSVYGLQRMPVTLFIDQWERVASEVCPMVLKYAKDNEGKEFLVEHKIGSKATGHHVRTKIRRKTDPMPVMADGPDAGKPAKFDAD